MLWNDFLGLFKIFKMAEKTKYDVSTTNLEIFNSQTVLVTDTNYKEQVADEEYVTDKVYNQYEHRILDHPNNYLGAFIHLLKASLGTGILAVPRAFKNAGLVVGVFGNILIGILCTHAVYILIQASEKMCVKAKVPSLGFADTAEEVFKQGPPPLRKWSGFAKLFIEFALISTYYLGIGVYLVFISISLTKLFSYYYPETESWDKYIFKLIIMVLLMVLCQIRNVKQMVPFSFIANVMLVTAFSITGYYIFSGLGDVDKDKIKMANGLSGIPSFFSTVLFAMEGIGCVMPVENSMPKSKFLGPFGVLNSAMTIVVLTYTTMGFFGYYRYGDEIAATITENLPDDEILAQVAQAAIATSVFFSFMLSFFVPTDILWQRIKLKIPESRHNIAQILLRIVMVAVVTGVAIIGGKNLGSLIDLIGAIFFSSLGFLVPAVLDTVVNWNDGLGIFYWKLYKNIFMVILAIFGMTSGSYYAIQNFV